MKKIIYSIIAGFGLFSITSCSGMLDTDGASDSSRMVVDPELNQKSDSVSFAYGVMEAMQQLADQYFLQNEMRGDLSAPTAKATTHLKELASFSVSQENKYDSVYLYYKVINNCNYYLAHRDTALYTGSDNVVINEYVAIAAYRAWAYLQLTTQYGDVPYVTEPVSTVSQINAQTANTDKMSILASQADYLQALKNRYNEDQIQVPSYRQANTYFSIGRMNWNTGINKFINPKHCFIPLNVILGDLYLEMGRYLEATTCYYQFLRYEGKESPSNLWVNNSNTRQPQDGYTYEWPIPNTNTDITLTNGQAKWDQIFISQSLNYMPDLWEVISYIPSAVNYMRGRIYELPELFGYDYYGTTGNRISNYRIWGCPQTTEIQIAPSATYKEMSENAPYYYITKDKDPVGGYYIGDKKNIGDGRANMISAGRTAATSSNVYVQKPSTGYVYLYRLSTVFLRLAEALNRAGYPDLAFYILKTGFGSNDIGKYLARKYEAGVSPFPEKYYFISEKSYQFLHNSNVSMLVEADSVYFLNTASKHMVGIHFHGAGAVDDGATWMSAYNYKDVVEERIEKIRGDFGLPAGAYSEEDYINAVEDLLCDEYALEFAFEGTRFTDLLRIARHKNMAGSFGGTFGDTWLSKKLENNAAGITTQNCYLPFK